RARRNPHRVARHLAPPTRGSRARRGRTRDRAVEAAARGEARPSRARLLVRQGIGGALQARPSVTCPAGRLRRCVHGRVGLELADDRPAAAAPLQHRAVLAAHVRARAGGCLRPDLREGHGHGHARATVVQRGARHLDQVMAYELAAYEPAQREDYLRLLREAWGEFALSGPEFDWWFRENPVGSLMSVAR